MNDIQQFITGETYILCRNKSDADALGECLTIKHNIENALPLKFAKKNHYLLGVLDGKLTTIYGENLQKKRITVFYQGLVEDKPEPVAPSFVTATVDGNLKTTEVWVEGYDGPEGPHTATYYGKYIANNLREAVEYAIRAGTLPRMFVDMDKLTLAGHRILDNEADARRKFG